jgi:hypothetical protein
MNVSTFVLPFAHRMALLPDLERPLVLPQFTHL